MQTEAKVDLLVLLLFSHALQRTGLVHFRAFRNDSLALVNWILAFQNVIIKIAAKVLLIFWLREILDSDVTLD